MGWTFARGFSQDAGMGAEKNTAGADELLLLNKGVNPTAMRLLVLRALSGKGAALGVSELEAALVPADRVTVYRTLKTFLAHGVAHQVDDGSGVLKYALCAEACEAEGHRDSHAHFHCTVCGETRCLERVAVAMPKLPAGFRGREMRVVVEGVCPRCG